MAEFRTAYRQSLSGYHGYKVYDTLEGDFAPAYKGILKAEGGYVNDPNDKGGETFAGIARNYNPSWPGWAVIDNVKNTTFAGQDLTNKNTVAFLNKVLFGNPGLMQQHYDFTKKTFWDTVRGDDITDQDTANIIFDFVWGSGGSAIKVIKAAIDVTKGNTAALHGPLVTTAMLTDINTLPPEKLYPNIYGAREKFFYAIVAKNPSQEKFLKGWLNRLATFKNKWITEAKKNAGSIGGGLIAATLLALGIYKFTSSKK